MESTSTKKAAKLTARNSLLLRTLRDERHADYAKISSIFNEKGAEAAIDFLCERFRADRREQYRAEYRAIFAKGG